LEDLQEIESRGVAEMEQNPNAAFQLSANESWSVMPLNEEFMLVSRRGRRLPSALRERLLAILDQKGHGAPHGTRKNTE
jgi:hypothetical protein